VTPDGQRVVSASADGSLKVWDLARGRAEATLEGHASGVNACAVMPDGQRVVSASDDRTLKMWDLQTGTCFLTHRANARYLAVATTATAIVAGAAAGALVCIPMAGAGLKLLGNPRYPNMAEDLARSIRVLKKLKPDIFLDGHPEEFYASKLARLRAGESPNPLVDRGGFAKYLAEAEADLQHRLEDERSGWTP
jgi:hypothetical protein